VVAAVAAGGGGGSGSDASGRGSTPGVSSPGGSSAPQAVNLSGRWIGSVASGNGETAQWALDTVQCTGRWDLEANLTQSGSSLTGNGTSTLRSLQCNIPAPLPPVIGNVGSGTMSGSVGAGTLSFRAGEFDFTGTYNANTIEAVSTKTIEGAAITITWKLVR
jgi:hypothetical protein